MLKEIDARGRSCPEPVIMTMNAIDSGDKKLKIIVDTNVAVENISRFANSRGYKVDVDETNEDFEINLSK
ncbi:sulfurtransferase TusA family protein [Tissierella creatinophila]|uniref:UPF0033 domain-containing protein n=1 Tax=Tissierella creatinophila DSM 6911 TaxID=1123403 RepID=A0A1U7M7F8_TISCR|nr:sulfurtransferase TusA family protein [Tissierella creatinophila]OLS03149.1 hypothetical protein TICRE_08500 [Tissierella creatinophila DSM 6911]